MHQEETEAIYKAALQRFGSRAQMQMCQEECGELIVEISHLLRAEPPWEGTMRYKVMDEIADVLVMAEQMRMMFDTSVVDEIKTAKLRRLQERLGLAMGQVAP